MIDDASASLLKVIRQSGRPPVHQLSPQRAREPRLLDVAPALADDVTVVDRTADRPDGSALRLRVVVPEAGADRVVLYLHGGGWVTGSPEAATAVCSHLAVRTGAAVVIPEYRLAPEHPFPAAIDDARVALEWTTAAPDSLIPAAPIAVGGDSAGANLAIALARHTAGDPSADIDALLLVYPVTDSDFDRPSYRAAENQLILTREAMLWFFRHYAPPAGHALADISPLRADDLARMPPTAVVTAGHDPLHDEGVAFVTELRRHAVPVCHLDLDDQMHGFFTWPGVLPAALRAVDWLASAWEHLCRPSAAAATSPNAGNERPFPAHERGNR